MSDTFLCLIFAQFYKQRHKYELFLNYWQILMTALLKSTVWKQKHFNNFISNLKLLNFMWCSAAKERKRKKEDHLNFIRASWSTNAEMNYGPQEISHSEREGIHVTSSQPRWWGSTALNSFRLRIDVRRCSMKSESQSQKKNKTNRQQILRSHLIGWNFNEVSSVNHYFKIRIQKSTNLCAHLTREVH